MDKILLFAAIILTFSCSQDKQTLEETVLNDEKVKWIQDNRKLPENDSLFYLSNPAPIFRKTFIVDKNIKNAKLYNICRVLHCEDK